MVGIGPTPARHGATVKGEHLSRGKFCEPEPFRERHLRIANREYGTVSGSAALVKHGWRMRIKTPAVNFRLCCRLRQVDLPWWRLAAARVLQAAQG